MGTEKKDRSEAGAAVAGAATGSAADLCVALEESVKLQSFYANLLNHWDGGARIGFKDGAAWIARLREIGRLPNSAICDGDIENDVIRLRQDVVRSSRPDAVNAGKYRLMQYRASRVGELGKYCLENGDGEGLETSEGKIAEMLGNFFNREF